MGSIWPEETHMGAISKPYGWSEPIWEKTVSRRPPLGTSRSVGNYRQYRANVHDDNIGLKLANRSLRNNPELIDIAHLDLGMLLLMP
jgi:hypothetical protein